MKLGPNAAWGRAAVILELALCILLAAGCGKGRSRRVDDQDHSAASPQARELAASPAGRPASTTETGEPTFAEMHNVDLRIAEGATLHVSHLVGKAAAARRGDPVVVDDKTSYTIRIDSAETWLGYRDLSLILNTYTFAFDEAPIKDLEISREEDPGEADEIQLKGRLRKALGIAFEIEGRPEVTPDGKIRIRTTSIQVLDIKVGGLLHALGLEPKEIMGNLEERGVRAAGDDLILDPGRALPPPRITGRLTGIRVEAKGLGLTFGESRTGTRSEANAPNYLWFRRGTVRIGKMTQRDADLRIVDQDPADPLDFYPDSLNRQLVAGYAKLGASGGLTLFLPDYGDIR